tara:strand:+ start:8955 stop:9941 length:987 start_codon:yes stop_codon:yes gene_type:complete
MLVDYPNYSHANPWQIETIDKEAKIEIKRVNSIEEISNINCNYLHISWEDAAIRFISTGKILPQDDFNYLEERLNKFIKIIETKKKLRTRIVWTIHNQNSHFFAKKFISLEKKLREFLFEITDLILIMSEKHLFIVPDNFRKKVKILPHYIPLKKNIYPIIKNLDNKKIILSFGNINNYETSKIIHNNFIEQKNIIKFFSKNEWNYFKQIDDGISLVINRKFSNFELEQVSQICNIALYLKKPQFNSGIFNHYLGNKLIIFHYSEGLKYFDYPEFYNQFIIDKIDLNNLDLRYYELIMKENEKELDEFIQDRSSEKISKLFWSHLKDI